MRIEKNIKDMQALPSYNPKTEAKKGIWDRIRISVRAERVLEERSPEATQLFEKVVIERGGSESDKKRLSELWTELSFGVLELPNEEVFDIKRVAVDVPAYARIFESVKCSVCGEDVMEPRVRMKDGKPVCIPCASQEYYQLAGDGISIKQEDFDEKKNA